MAVERGSEFVVPHTSGGIYAPVIPTINYSGTSAATYHTAASLLNTNV